MTSISDRNVVPALLRCRLVVAIVAAALGVASLTGCAGNVPSKDKDQPPAPGAGPFAGAIAAAKGSLPAARTRIAEREGPGAPKANALMLDEPLPVITVGLKELRQVGPGGANPLLKDTANKVIVPVSAHGKVYGAMTVDRVNNEWRPPSFFNEDLARQLAAARADALATPGSAPAGKFRAVVVRGVNATFLAIPPAPQAPNNKDFTLRSMADVQSAGIKKNEELAPADALQKLSAAAQRYNDLPAGG